MMLRLTKTIRNLLSTGEGSSKRGSSVVANVESNRSVRLMDEESLVEINYPSEYRARPVSLRYEHRDLAAQEASVYESVSLRDGLFFDNALSLFRQTRGPFQFLLGALFGMMLYAMGAGQYLKQGFSLLTAMFVSVIDVLQSGAIFQGAGPPVAESPTEPKDTNRLPPEAAVAISMLPKEEEKHHLEDTSMDKEISKLNLESFTSFTEIGSLTKQEIENQPSQESEMEGLRSDSLEEAPLMGIVETTEIKSAVESEDVDSVKEDSTEMLLTLDTDLEDVSDSQHSAVEDTQEAAETTQEHEIKTAQEEVQIPQEPGNEKHDVDIHTAIVLEDIETTNNTDYPQQETPHIPSATVYESEDHRTVGESAFESTTEEEAETVSYKIVKVKESIPPVHVPTPIDEVEPTTSDLESDFIPESPVPVKHKPQILGSLIVSESRRQHASQLRKELEAAITSKSEESEQHVLQLVQDLEKIESVKTINETQALLFLWGSWELVHTTDAISKRILNALNATDLLDDFRVQVHIDGETKHVFSKIWIQAKVLEEVLQIPPELNIRTSVETELEAETDLLNGVQLLVPQILTTIDLSEVKIPDRVRVFNFNLETKQVQDLWTRVVKNASVSFKGTSNVRKILESLLPEPVLYLIKTRAQQKLRVTYLDNHLCILRDEESVSILKKTHSPAEY